MSEKNLLYIDIYLKKEADIKYFEDGKNKYSVIDILRNKNSFMKKEFSEVIPKDFLLEMLKAYIAIYPEKINDILFVLFDKESGVCITSKEYIEKSEKIDKKDAEYFSVNYYNSFHSAKRKLGASLPTHKTDNFVEDIENCSKKVLKKYNRAIDRESYNIMFYGDLTRSSSVTEVCDYYIAGSYSDKIILSNKIEARRNEITKIDNTPSYIKKYTMEVEIGEDNEVILPELVEENKLFLTESGAHLLSYGKIKLEESEIKKIDKIEYLKIAIEMDKKREKCMEEI